MQKTMVGESHRMTMLCVDSYEQGVPTGRFYNSGCNGGCPFRSLVQFLTEMESMLDQMSFPQSFTASRAFVRSGGVQSLYAEEPIQAGELATFSIRILFRQNASWQGSVKWLEGGLEQSFRSALELIFLIDSVLSDMDSQKVG